MGKLRVTVIFQSNIIRPSQPDDNITPVFVWLTRIVYYGTIAFIYLSTRVECLSRGKPHMYAYTWSSSHSKVLNVSVKNEGELKLQIKSVLLNILLRIVR